MLPNVSTHTFRWVSLKRSLLTTRKITEIIIPVPWGHVAGPIYLGDPVKMISNPTLRKTPVEYNKTYGKWWGDTTKQPVLALHGWQDNAGTFDPLLDKLYAPSSVLAIDLPGHGLSSHLPPSMNYPVQHYVMTLLRIKEHFGWTGNLSLLRHSYGGIMAFIFAALFPELVYSLITFDVAKPLISTKGDLVKLRPRTDKMIMRLSRSPGTNPGYTSEELMRRWVDGSNGSLNAEAVRVLFKRGAKFDTASGLYNLTRDPKVKICSLMQFDENQCLEFARNIKCYYLAIKFTRSDWFDYSPTYLETLARAAKSFKVVILEGTHHGHLNEPEKVAPVLKDFFNNHGIR